MFSARFKEKKPVVEVPFVKSERKTIERSVKRYSATRRSDGGGKYNSEVYSYKRTALSSDDLKSPSEPKTSVIMFEKTNNSNGKTIFNIAELSSFKGSGVGNVYTDFKPRLGGSAIRPNDAPNLLKRPGSYKPFWMRDKSEEVRTNVAKKREELDRLMDMSDKDTYRGVLKTAKGTESSAHNQNISVHKSNVDGRKRLDSERSVSFDLNNDQNKKSFVVGNVDKSRVDAVEETVVKASKQPREPPGGHTRRGDRVGKINNMTKLFTATGLTDRSRVAPMYVKGASGGNKFKDVIVNNNLVKDGGRLPRIYREDGQRVYRLGERTSSYGGGKTDVQDFGTLRSQCISEGRMFEDPDFPPVDASLYFSQRPDRRFEWLRPHEIAENPQLFVEGFSRFDVQQGELGDCWLLAAVANLTLHRKLFFQIVPDDQSFDEEYAGIFHFRFWQYGRWVDVVIDDRLPTHRGKLVFLHSSESNEFWSALLEKAYAKLHGSYEALKGGSTCEAMEDFTGGVTEMYEMTEVPPNLYTILMHGYQRSSLMGCSIEPDPSVLEAETPQGLIRGHAYSITRVCYVDIETPGRQGKIPLLRLRNPWGNEAEWNGAWSDKSPEWRYITEDDKEEIGLTFDDDGEFWMSYRDFLSHFTRLEICNLNPDSLDPDETPEGCKKKWEMSVFEGEWVRGVTAGGCRNYLDTFWKNPQYTLTLTDPDEDDEQNMCTVIVALMQKNRRSQRSAGLDCLTIGFALYKQPNSGQRPLQLDFFKYNASVARSPSFINLREVSCRFKLPPGTYCIVPSTFEPNDEGEFLLRVFTETSCTITENDEEIGMGEVDDRVKDIIPETPSTPEDPVRQFFLKLAGSDEEVDWLELKEILDYAMRNELGQGGGGGGHMAPVQQNSAPPQQERGFLEALVCSFCAPICKEFGIDLEQVAGQQGGAETVHLTQPETRGQGFSKDVCRSMVAMLDNDGSGKLGFDEFKTLWVDIRKWRAVFRLYDPEGTGRIPASHLRDALHSSGYTLNNHILNILAHRYGSRDGFIAFDDFIMCAVRLKTMIAKNEPLENLERDMPLWDS